MIRRFPTISLAVLLMIGMLGAGCSNPPGTKITDDDLKIWNNVLSPDGRSRIVIYQHDIGAMGYGRVLWAVTPANLDGADLTKFKLPDGYRAEGWTKDSEIEVSKWQPYYGMQDNREIQDGDLFNATKVKMVVNNSAYELPGYEESKSNQ